VDTERLAVPLLRALDIEGSPFGTNIVLTGPPGIGKTVFCENLMSDCLTAGVNVICTALDTAPKDIRERVLRASSYEGPGFVFIDAYSWLLGEEYEKYHVSHLSNLSDLSVKIYNALNELSGKDVVIFDSISTLFVYNAENEITRFIQVNMARIKQSGSIGIWTVEEGIHNAAFYNALRHLSEGIVEMRFEDDHELQRFIRVHTFRGITHATNWLPFAISSEGKLIVKR
jgi:KaiC/GvpD/RAD55 family RecA-like ATPase